MRQPIKLIVRKAKVRKDGTALISVQYCYSAEQRVVLSTGVAIPIQYWNKKTGRLSKELPPTYGNIYELEKTLTDQLRKAEDIVEYALKKKNVCPMQFLKDNFHLPSHWKLEQMSHAEKNLNVFYHIDQYVKSKESSVKRCTINVINAMKSHLKSFEAYRKIPIIFDSFDVDFYEEFVKYLTYEMPQMRRRTLIKGL